MSRELHRTGPDQDRFLRVLLGKSGNAESLHRAFAAVADREPDEIAGAAVFLAARAGTFMTGQTIVIDGGATIS